MAKKDETKKKDTAKKKNTPQEKAPIPKPKPKSTKKKKDAEKDKNAVDNLVKQNQPTKRAERDMNEMISVISITNSPLIYKSRAQAGYVIEWGGFLEENWMEYKELITMRNTQRAFFEKPWIIAEWDVLEDLRVEQYYKNMIDLSALDDVYDLRPEEMADLLDRVPKGIQDLIVDRAYELIEDGDLDSINLIETIQEKCNVDLQIARN